MAPFFIEHSSISRYRSSDTKHQGSLDTLRPCGRPKREPGHQRIENTVMLHGLKARPLPTNRKMEGNIRTPERYVVLSMGPKIPDGRLDH
jgi:hypothetical protein